MAQRGLPHEIDHLRDQIDSLKKSLDQTLQTFEDLNTKTVDLAQDARQMVDLLGEGRPTGFPWGLILTLALGAGAVLLISPETITSLGDFLTAQYRSITGSTQRSTG